MTTLVGIQGNWGSVIATDSRIVEGSKIIENNDKAIVHKGFIMAFVGDVRAMDILMHNFIPSKPEQWDRVYITSEFIPEMIKCYNNTNCNTKSFLAKDEGILGVTIMVSYNGKIYIIDKNLAIIGGKNGILADGDGGDLALGCMEALYTKEITKKEAIALARKTINIAAKHNTNTGKPAHVYSQDRK